MRYVGTGDRGGSPDIESLDRLERSVAAAGPISVRCGASDSLVDELTADELAALPVFDGELLLPTHGTGCWTSQSALKRWNRRNEQLADAAERAATVADWLGAIDYPYPRLTEAWGRFLWHQMHDDLTGTSIPRAYEFTWNDEAVAANLLAGVLTDSVGAIAARLDTHTAGLPLVVFNPGGRGKEEVVEAVLDSEELPAGRVRVLDGEGEPVPCQSRSLGDGRTALLFLARVDPVSFSTYEVLPALDDEPLPTSPGSPSADATGLENHRYRVSVDSAGDVASIFDKHLGRELLERPLRFELLANRSMRWPAWEIRPETVLDRSRTAHVGGPATIRVVEQGPVRATLEIQRQALGSRYLHRLRLSAGEAGERLEIVTVVDWATRGRLLKISFPTTASAALATYDLGVGTVRRGNNRPERYEVPAQQWAGIDDDAGEFGVAVLNDCKYGWDKPADNELRLSLLHSPFSWRKYPHQRTQDHGRHRFTVALLGHLGESERHRIAHHAEALNQPLEAFVVPARPGTLGRSFSALRLDDPGVSVRALKRSEDGFGWAVRLQEVAGRSHEAVRLDLHEPPMEARTADGFERPGEPASLDDGSVVFDIGKAGLKTLLLSTPPRYDPGPRAEQRPIDLPFDHRATSSHGKAGTAADFDGSGHSIPGELWPQRVRMGEIEFQPGPAERDLPNAVRCRGQQIDLPAGFRRLWLLAASAGGPTEATFRIDGREQTVTIAGWTGWIAQRPRPRRWLGLRPAIAGSLIRDDIAWLGTHRHHLGKVDPYVFCHVFRYALDIDPGGTVLTLPEAEGVRLFAATVSDHIGAPARPARPLYGD
jgi:alpha-mannosidase